MSATNQALSKSFVEGLYPWPFDGDLRVTNTALVIVDMQTDFCGEAGWLESRGRDLHPLRKPIEPIRRVLGATRAAGFSVIHTREGHRPDLVDLHANKRWRSAQDGAEIGAVGKKGRYLVRGEPTWDIIPELSPLAGEPIIDKPGKSAFYATDLDQLLKRAGLRNLVFCGMTTDCCVQSTLRDANDRGFECLLLEDCCAAASEENHLAQIEMFKLAGGHYGSVSDSGALLNVIS